MSSAAGAWSYRTGPWFAAFGPRVTVLLPESQRGHVIGVWSLVDGGAAFDEVLDALLASGLSKLPAFVLVSSDDGPTRLLLRGAGVTASLATDGDDITLDGSASGTWVERSVDGVTSLSVSLADADPDDEHGGHDFGVVTGLVRVSRIDRPPYAEPEPEPEPAEVAPEPAEFAPAAVEVAPAADEVALVVDEVTPVVDEVAPQPDEAAPLEAPDPLDEPSPFDEPAAMDAPAEGTEDPAPAPDPLTDPMPPAPAPSDWVTPWDSPPPAPPAPLEPPPLDPPAADLVDGGPVTEVMDMSGEVGMSDATSPDMVEPVEPVDPAEPAAPPVTEFAPPSFTPPPPAPAPPSDLPPAGAPPPPPLGIGSWEPIGGSVPPPTPPAPPAAAPADATGGTTTGAVAKLMFSDGQQVLVDRVILIGRAPEARRFDATEQPSLITVPSRLHEISSTHVEVRPGTGGDAGSALVTDMGSTNGTVLVQPGLQPEDLKPGIAVPLQPGAIINLGDGVTIQVTRP